MIKIHQRDSDEDEVDEETEEAETNEIEDDEADGEETENKITSTKSLQKVFIAHTSIDEIGWKHTKALSLDHPRTKTQALFLLDFSKNVSTKVTTGPYFLYEILTMADPIRSWFVNETVISNGNIYTFTPLDPLFFIIPVLAKTTKAMQLSDHLTDAFDPEVTRLFCNRISSKQLRNISFQKVSGDIEAYVYSEEGTLNWLSKKLIKISKFLFRKGINGSEVSVSSNFTKSSSSTLSAEDMKDPSKIPTEYLHYACDIVGDYIDDALKRKLLTKFGLPTEPERSKRKNNDSSADSGIDGNKKKLKVTDNVQPLEDYGSDASISVAASKITGRGKAKEKEFQKAAQGTPSLLSFFTPKAKKS